MAKTRREFLAEAAVGLAGVAAGAAGALPVEAQDPVQQPTPAQLPAGAPPAFGTGQGMGPEVSAATFTEAEKLAQVELSKPHLQMAASSWRGNLSFTYERRTGPRKVALPASVAPYSSWNPALPGMTIGPNENRFVRTRTRAPAAQERRSHRLRPRPPSFALDRDPQTHLRAPHHISISPASRNSIPNSSASSRSRETLALHKPSKPTPKSPPGTTAARSTASPGAEKIFSTPPAFPPPTAPNLSAIASPKTTPPSSSASTPPAPSSSPN